MNINNQVRKLVQLNFMSLIKRTMVIHDGVKQGSIVPPTLTWKNDLNKNEFRMNEKLFRMNILNNCLLLDANPWLLSDKISYLSIKDNILRKTISEPGTKLEMNIGLPFLTKDVELPSSENRELIDPVSSITEKKAVNVIRIRRKKMNKHKYKKLQKKMKYAFARIKSKRKAKREKEFLNLITQILKDGEDYDPKTVADENIKIMNLQPPVNRVRGYLAPQSVVQEHLKELKIRAQIDKKVEECLKKLNPAVSGVQQ